MESNSQRKTWLGTSIEDLCNGKGPWSFTETPIVISKYHNVLFELPVPLQEPPKPFHSSKPKHWDDDYVRMPFSTNNLFPMKQNGVDVLKSRWNLIKETFSKPITNSQELEKAISTYQNKLPKLTALHYFFEEILDEQESAYFFENVFPGIVKLALDLPNILPGSLPLLKATQSHSVSLSQYQIASLLANGFICAFPWRKDAPVKVPGINFARLYAAGDRPKRMNAIVEKLKCICHYFRRILQKTPVGVVTFERKFIQKRNMPRWDASDINLGNTKIHINSAGTIEDGLGFLQVDFANKNIGGGVLGYGCVQEEIRFIICPELIVSRLFIEQLGDQEAVIITGVERYSTYSGYGDDFQWSGNCIDDTPFDDFGRRKTSICVVDATKYNKSNDQFYSSALLRELNKAYAGFSSRETNNLAPVATGNWGCGAFGGYTHLKSLIQLMACTLSHRSLVYYSFGNEELRDDFYNMYLFLAENGITVTQLWRYLCRFSSAGLPKERLYSYIQQAHFDLKNQKSITTFFKITKREEEHTISTPSSSTKTEISESDTKNKVIEIQESPPIDVEEAIKMEEDEIIPATPSPKGSPKKFCRIVKSKSKCSQEKVEELLPKNHQEIFDFLDEIDGNANKPKDVIIDNNSVGSKTSESKDTEIEQVNEISTIVDEKMEVEEIPQPAQKPAKGSKRKISDYFSKIGSSNS